MNHYAGGYEVPPHSRRDIRALARSIRSRFGISESHAFPVMQFLEFALDMVYDDFELLILDEQKMGSDHGLTLPDKHLIMLREDVYEGAVARKGRDRFTVIHEIGHLLLHEDVPMAMAHRPAEGLPLYKNSEWQADCLAGELLMPYAEIKLMTVDSITETYLVSWDAARVQWKAAYGRGCA